MRRIGSLLLLTVVLASAAIGTSAAAGSPPRGVLSKVEYREFLASYEAMKHVGRERGTPTAIARHTCRALTGVTRLTAAEHAECEASLIFSYRFFAFPYELQRCQKDATKAAVLRCVLGSVARFEKAVRAFIRTDAASARAADPRGFSRHCLDYLLFTRDQARTTHALATGLKRYARAIRLGDARAISSAGNRIDRDLVASRQAMSFSISVSACPHQ